MQAENPLFSIVMPVYNRAGMLQDSIGSVLSQTYSNWELIVVDDGSTDGSAAVIKTFEDARIRYVYQQNAERGAARNHGISLSQGQFVCFLDSDDRLLPNHLQVAAEVVRFNPEVHVFHHSYEIHDPGGAVRTVREFPLKLNKFLVRENVISCNAIFIERRVLERFRFSEIRELSGTEDYYLWLQLASVYQIRHIPVVTSIIVNHAERSMAEVNFEKLRNRIFTFISLVENDRQVIKFIGLQWPHFRSMRYSYIALHAAVDGFRSEAQQYLRKAVLIYPLIVFTKRFAIIMKYLFKPGKSLTRSSR